MNKAALSPLRYPGAKRRLAHYISSLLENNQVNPDVFIEPFAGGASISIFLLSTDKVEKIGLADRDPRVAAFWEIVFSNDVNWLLKKIEKIKINVDVWKKFKNSSSSNKRQLALSCLFLNRTSFSGILSDSAGPIGGVNQKSKYSIDCRFPRERLIQRIEQLNKLKDRVMFTWNWSYKKTIRTLLRMIKNRKLSQNVMFYFDPPFFRNADRLYRFYFSENEHTEFRDILLSIKNPWLLSYDWAPEIKQLYLDKDTEESSFTELDIYYTASKMRMGREILITNLGLIPSSSYLSSKKSNNKGLVVINNKKKTTRFLKSHKKTNLVQDSSFQRALLQKG